MFVGRQYHTIDSKGRVAVPHKYRAELAGKDSRLVVTFTPTDRFRSLDLIPADTWEIITNEIVAAALNVDEAEDVRQALLGNYIHTAQPLVIDKQNRILIPPEHREYAGLQKDIVTSGDLRKLRLWNIEEYQRYTKVTADERAKLRRLPGVWL